VGIGNFTSTSIKVTSYTYLNGSYYKLCEKTSDAIISIQSIYPSINMSQCSSGITSELNNVSILANIQSLAVGDILMLRGLAGVITNTNVWTDTVIGTSNWFLHTVDSTNIVSASQLKISLVYSNLNYTTSTSNTNIT
jgi:hypothetical protein